MAVIDYVPSSTRIIHWTRVDFISRPSILAPIHLVQYDQRLPIIAVRLYNNGQKYTLPPNSDANILVGKIDGTFVTNPALGCNADRDVLYFEATYQMLYFSGSIFPVIELKLSDTEVASSSPITIIVDRNPVQESARESSNEYQSAEQFANDALIAKDKALEAANSAELSRIAAAQSERNAAISEQNARDYAMSGVELMESLKSSHSVQERLLDSDGNAITDSEENEVMGAIQFATGMELANAQNQIEILAKRNKALEEMIQDQNKILEESVQSLESSIAYLTEHSILDSDF